MFLSYKSWASKKSSLQNQFAPLKTHDPHQLKNALSTSKKSVSKPYMSTSNQNLALNKTTSHLSSSHLNGSNANG